jgi:ABC-type multidrug transport system fused ATPase/permease subunit
MIQSSLIILDLLGLALIGVIVAIASSSVQGKKLPEIIESLIASLNADNLPPQLTAALFGLTATTLLVLKSILSYYLGLKTFAFLARREATISEVLAKRIFATQITDLQKYSTPEYQHALTLGSSSVMGGVLGQSLTMATELMLQLVMLITLFFFSPLLTLLCLIFFLGIFLILNGIQGKKAQKWGTAMTRADVLSTSLIADAIGSYREILVSGRRHFFVARIKNARREAANFQVKKNMLTHFSKYIFEVSVIFAGLGISAFAFLTKTAVEAASLVAIFLTAAYRIAPSVLKLQQGILQLRGAAGATELFFEIDSHLLTSTKTNSYDKISVVRVLHTASIKDAVIVDNVNFTYQGRSEPALNHINLRLEANRSLAIVGPSGAGKTTLVDVILGVITPDEGEIKIFGQTPESIYQHKSLRMGYVPQNVFLTTGSILENISLGIERDNIDLDLAWEVLKGVHLDDFVLSLEDNIYSNVGERGSRLSGGQRQRLGIARALYQNPSLLVLDEATSSLDAESEYEISRTIQSIKHKVTIIVIAHRLSTVIDSDVVVYMKEGRIIAQGTFDSLRDSVPDFDKQANLMGIKR